MHDLKDKLKKFKGQPIEVITESGFKFCGIDVESDDDSVVIIDDKSRLVSIVIDHIDAVIEPQMRLKRLCKDNDCDCEEDNERRNRRDFNFADNNEKRNRRDFDFAENNERRNRRNCDCE